jgi:hypothetical protein
VVIGDSVLISSAYYRLGSLLLKVHSDGRGFDEEWKGTMLEAHWSTPIYHQGYLYGFSGRNEPDARFRCVDWQTGKVLWERDEGWRYGSKQPPVYGRGSLLLADQKLIVLGEGGLLGVFKPSHLKPLELCRWQIPELHYPIWTAPVLSRKRLYLRSEDRLMCFDWQRR